MPLCCSNSPQSQALACQAPQAIAVVNFKWLAAISCIGDYDGQCMPGKLQQPLSITQSLLEGISNALSCCYLKSGDGCACA